MLDPLVSSNHSLLNNTVLLLTWGERFEFCSPFISHPTEQIPPRRNHYSLNGLSDFLQALLPHKMSFRTRSVGLSTPSHPIDSQISVDVSVPISVPSLVLTFSSLHKTVCKEQIIWQSASTLSTHGNLSFFSFRCVQCCGVLSYFESSKMHTGEESERMYLLCGVVCRSQIIFCTLSCLSTRFLTGIMFPQEHMESVERSHSGQNSRSHKHIAVDLNLIEVDVGKPLYTVQTIRLYRVMFLLRFTYI